MDSGLVGTFLKNVLLGMSGLAQMVERYSFLFRAGDGSGIAIVADYDSRDYLK